ncbi:MAG: hypothetical protein LC657_01785 [Desulfobacteraceae bacterium]|nr:hypothetical protein [Desulfobacteraceae bacterium]
MPAQKHFHRAEYWTVVSGTATSSPGPAGSWIF